MPPKRSDLQSLSPNPVKMQMHDYDRGIAHDNLVISEGGVPVMHNPLRPELDLAVPAGAGWQDQRCTMMRLFMQQVQSIITDFGQDGVAVMFRIEWQSRGMPHVHVWRAGQR